MPTIGRKPGTQDSGWGEMFADTARVTYIGSFSSATWVTSVGARMGRNTSVNAQARPIFYDMAGPTSAPTSLVYAPPAKTISSYMADSWSGTNYEWAVTGLPLAAGRKLGGGIWADVASIAYGQDNSGARMYFRNATSVPNPYNASSNSPQGAISVWMTGVSNRAPSAPGIVAPRPGSVTIDPTPAITIAFADPDEPYGDVFGKYKIELWNDANDTRLASSGVVSTNPTQKVAREATWVVPTTLAAGTYTVRANTYDYFGVSSPTRQWTFTVNAGGVFTGVTLQAADIDGAQGGVLVTNETRPDMTAVWNHDNGSATETIKVRLVNAATGAPYRSEESFASAQADGATVDVAYRTGWADMARGATRYAWEIAAVDALGSTSPWSRSPSFVVNAVPVVAFASGSPANNQYVATRPKIRATVTDATDGAGTHTVVLRWSDDGVTFTDHPMLHVGGGIYELQLTAAQMPALDTYTYQVVATDPQDLVGESATRTLNYVAPATVTITAPVGTVETGTPTVTATVDRTVSQYRVIIATDERTFYDSAVVAGSGSSIAHPVPPATLPNATDYALELWVKTSDGLEGTFRSTFRVEYPAPAAMTNVTIAAVHSSVFDRGNAAFEQKPNVEMVWDVIEPSQVSDEDWIGYLVTRGDGTQWEIPDRYQPGMTDTTPPGGIEQVYHVQYQVRVNAGFDTVASVPVELRETVTIRHATITSENPDDPAVTLHLWEDRNVAQVIGVEPVEILGQAMLDTWHSPLDYDRVSGTFTPFDDRSGNNYFTARQVVEAARELARPLVDANGRVVPRALYWRDPKGRAFPFRITEPVEEDDQHLHDRAVFTLGGIQVGGGS